MRSNKCCKQNANLPPVTASMAAIPPPNAIFRFMDLPAELRVMVYRVLPNPVVLRVGGPHGGFQVFAIAASNRLVFFEFRALLNGGQLGATTVHAIFSNWTFLTTQYAHLARPWMILQPHRVVTAVVRGFPFRIRHAHGHRYYLTPRSDRILRQCIRAARLFTNLTHLLILAAAVDCRDLRTVDRPVVWAVQQTTPFAVRVEVGWCPRCYQAQSGNDILGRHTLLERPFHGAWERQAHHPGFQLVQDT